MSYQNGIPHQSFDHVAVLPFDLSADNKRRPGEDADLRARFARHLSEIGYTVITGEQVDSALKNTPIKDRTDLAGMKKAAAVLDVEAFVFARLSYETRTSDRTVREFLRVDLVSPEGREFFRIQMVDERDFGQAMESLKRQIQESAE